MGIADQQKRAARHMFINEKVLLRKRNGRYQLFIR
jgi:hypothetical protein